MESLLISALSVAIAEMGDKTQLLAMVLAARFKKPLPIILGILVATLGNHALAAGAGLLAARWLGPDLLRWVLGASFLIMAGWIMVPDKEDEDTDSQGRFGAFLATLIAFFLVEMGDKTQIATIALAARFNDLIMVTLGTTTGMMAANVPAVFLGGALSAKLPMTAIHAVAALIFAGLGLWVLMGDGVLASLGLAN